MGRYSRNLNLLTAPDTVLVTENGIENFTAFLASTPDEIEAVMKEDGVLSHVPRLP